MEDINTTSISLASLPRSGVSAPAKHVAQPSTLVSDFALFLEQQSSIFFSTTTPPISPSIASVTLFRAPARAITRFENEMYALFLDIGRIWAYYELMYSTTSYMSGGAQCCEAEIYSHVQRFDCDSVGTPWYGMGMRVWTDLLYRNYVVRWERVTDTNMDRKSHGGKSEGTYWARRAVMRELDCAFLLARETEVVGERAYGDIEFGGTVDDEVEHRSCVPVVRAINDNNSNYYTAFSGAAVVLADFRPSLASEFDALKDLDDEDRALVESWGRESAYAMHDYPVLPPPPPEMEGRLNEEPWEVAVEEEEEEDDCGWSEIAAAIDHVRYSLLNERMGGLVMETEMETPESESEEMGGLVMEMEIPESESERIEEERVEKENNGWDQHLALGGGEEEKGEEFLPWGRLRPSIA